MDDSLYFRLFAGGFGGGSAEWVAVLAFFTIAIVYLVVPCTGYRLKRPGAIIASLYLLIAHVSLSLVILVWQYLQVLDLRTFRDKTNSTLFAIASLKLVLFLLAMLFFVAGLRSLEHAAGEEKKNRELN